MSNGYAMVPKLAAFIHKVALSRLDKEVAAGNVSYSDVDPRIPRPMGESTMAKRISRAGAHAPTPRSPEEVNRTRTLNQALFDNAHRQAAGRPDMSTQPAWLSEPPNAWMSENGGPGVPVPEELRPTHHRVQNLTPGSARLHSGPTEYTLHNDLPAMGPSTMDVGGGRSQVYAPDTSSQFMRTINEPLGAQRLQARALAMTPGMLPVFQENADRLMAPKADVDRTLNRGILEHELGEADRMAAADVTPNASHFGLEPIGRENMALRGDPEAQDIMAQVRRSNPDDALVQKKLREAGNTADNPLPIGGRAMRSVDRNLAKNPQQLSPATRGRTVQMQLQQEVAKQLAGPQPPSKQTPMRNFTTLPHDVKGAISQGVGIGHGAFKDIQAMPKEQQVMGGLRRALKLPGELKPHLNTIKKFMR